MSDIHLSCTDCDELFPDYFEGDLAASRHAQFDAHVATCARCQGIVRDFDSIRREAAALTDLEPSRDLWSGIEARIEPAVVSIGERRQRRPMSWLMAGFAAAGLVIVSSSVTWLATRGSMSDRGARQVADNPRATPTPGASDDVPSAEAPPAATPAEAPPASEKANTAQPAPSRGSSSSGSVPTVRRPSVVTRPAKTSLASNVPAPTASELALAPEIAQLQKTLHERRSDLDPETVRVVEQSLKLIDLAVDQAKAALSRDPASGFLNEQLDGALQKKVELLRTVALLPSRS
jgi:hypothetical protein